MSISYYREKNISIEETSSKMKRQYVFNTGKPVLTAILNVDKRKQIKI